jgi:hypothetical protein
MKELKKSPLSEPLAFACTGWLADKFPLGLSSEVILSSKSEGTHGFILLSEIPDFTDFFHRVYIHALMLLQFVCQRGLRTTDMETL